MSLSWRYAMKPVLLVLAMLALFSTAAPAGPNAHGAIVVHTNDAYDYLSTTVCTTTLGQPADCESPITRTDKASAAVVWFLAAFPTTGSPRVVTIYFGINFDDTNLDPTTKFGLCGPAGAVEVPEYGWPSNTAGNTIGFGAPIIGNTLFRFYYFKVDEFSGLPGPFLCSTINPSGGFAAYLDDGFPSEVDIITRFGCVRWYADGYSPCKWPPGPPTGGCCFPTGECILLTLTQCQDQGGLYTGDDTVCLPDNPCVQPGACCDLEMGTCAFVLETECLAPHLFLGGACAPVNPCPLKGACCDLATGNCMYVTQANCPAPYLWYAGVTCAPVNPCVLDPRGACCLCDYYCLMLTEADCLAHNGVPHPPGTDCETFPCAPPPLGACCLGQECLIMSVWCCDLQNGAFQGSDTACEPNPCEATSIQPTTWGEIKSSYR
jgi:hypothetical protein